jgi:prepilin-type N-terminal cleavage/methylation domain-containing protein
MKISFDISRHPRGFSLAEMLAALTIGAMILVAVISIYSRAERSAGAISRRFDSSRLPAEVLQRIAEDLDRTISAGSNAKITIENKFENGLPAARLTIRKTIRDGKDKEQIFEEITWQSSIDVDSNSLVLYRSHSGMALEDKLLDEKRESWEKDYSFVPICEGVTFFKIQVPQGETFQDNWTGDALPAGIVATISFARPFDTVTGTFDVPDAEKVTRTIAIDRTRKIQFEVIPIEEKKKGNEQLSGISK